MNNVKDFDQSVCESCEKTRAMHHACTWGVSGVLLGCSTYYLCATCVDNGSHRVERSTLSPCAIKHVKPV